MTRNTSTRSIKAIEADEASWEAFFARRGVEPLRIEYETLAGTYAATVREALDFLARAFRRYRRRAARHIETPGRRVQPIVAEGLPASPRTGPGLV